MIKKIIHNNRGFTLIEIIASIALLALVVMLLLPIFPQIFHWTGKTEDELTASNLVGQVAYDLKNNEQIDFANVDSCNGGNMGNKTPISEIYEINEIKYQAFYQLCAEDSIELNKSQLYQARLLIYKENNNHDLVSESYTYVKVLNNQGEQS
ncbi:prepilin-type N-terminal cleavage/methylation domain-containing protein [Oceanobacillus kapialis]|uniref:Prepilin-type N-terminal cleavage/methylation domain-containing protein n=1 Tax=Oceanobacillus kapialis TaxID=481353 RepID=A0ABW5PX69_9BACI